MGGNRRRAYGPQTKPPKHSEDWLGAPGLDLGAPEYWDSFRILFTQILVLPNTEVSPKY